MHKGNHSKEPISSLEGRGLDRRGDGRGEVRGEEGVREERWSVLQVHLDSQGERVKKERGEKIEGRLMKRDPRAGERAKGFDFDDLLLGK